MEESMELIDNIDEFEDDGELDEWGIEEDI